MDLFIQKSKVYRLITINSDFTHAGDNIIALPEPLTNIAPLIKELADDCNSFYI
jgi:hypothetical protein